MQETRRQILITYRNLFLLGGIYYLWIRLTGVAFPCVFHRLTGLDCPGCGLTRMCLALIHLDVPNAYQSNPVGLVMMALWNLIALIRFLGRPAWMQTRSFMKASIGVTMLVMLLWGIGRNLY